MHLSSAQNPSVAPTSLTKSWFGLPAAHRGGLEVITEKLSMQMMEPLCGGHQGAVGKSEKASWRK